jgi:hypothetical protein
VILRTSEGFVENFGPVLIARVGAEAPGVRLRFAQKPNKDSAPLRDGLVDLDTGAVEGVTAPEVRTQALFRDRLMGVVRLGHPLARGQVTPARYAAGRHICVSRQGFEKGPIDEALAAMGLEREFVTIVGGFATGTPECSERSRGPLRSVEPGSGRYSDLDGPDAQAQVPTMDGQRQNNGSPFPVESESKRPTRRARVTGTVWLCLALILMPGRLSAQYPTWGWAFAGGIRPNTEGGSTTLRLPGFAVRPTGNVVAAVDHEGSLLIRGLTYAPVDNQFWVLTIDPQGRITNSLMQACHPTGPAGETCTPVSGVLAGTNMLWLIAARMSNGPPTYAVLTRASLVRVFDPSQWGSNSGRRMVAGPQGNACLELLSYTTGDERLIFLDAQGTLRTYFSTVQLAGLAMASDGSVVASPSATNLLVKYSSTGDVLWKQEETLSRPEHGEVAVDGQGNIYVLGNRLLSFTASGVRRWSLDLSVPATKLAAGKDGRVYLGSTLPGELRVTCVGEGGAVRWVIGAQAASGTTVEHLGVDDAGRVYLTGFLGGLARFDDISVQAPYPRALYFASIRESTNAGLPTIQTQPAGASLRTGSSHTLQVTATGVPSPRYQWLREGVVIAGATDAWLNLSDLQPAQSGRYTVVITNVVGSVTSAPAVLNIGFPPSFKTQPQSVLALLSDDVRFAVEVEGTPPLSFQWLRKGSAIARATNAALGIVDAQLSDAASYRVLVTNPWGTISSGAATLSLECQLICNSAGGGDIQVQPAGTRFPPGTTISISALPHSGYAFDQWSDGYRNNPRNLILLANYSVATRFRALEPVSAPLVFVEDQRIDGASVTHLGAALVRFEVAGANRRVLCTLDGSPPEPGGRRTLVYAAPFRIFNSVRLRALAVDTQSGESKEAPPVDVVIAPGVRVTATTRGGGDVRVQPADDYLTPGSVVRLVALPEPGWEFMGWLGDPASLQSSGEFVIQHDTAVHAVFGASVAVEAMQGGTVERTPDSPVLPFGSRVNLAAIPAEGWRFARWNSGDPDWSNPMGLVLTSTPPRFVASFEPLEAGQRAFTVRIVGKGRVALNPPGHAFPLGQAIRVEAQPDSDEGFLGWEDLPGSGMPLRQVTLTNSLVLTAKFTERAKWVEGLRVGADGQWAGRLSGRLNTVYAVEASEDFRSWEFLTRLTNQLGAVDFIMPTPSASPLRFHRAVEVDR